MKQYIPVEKINEQIEMLQIALECVKGYPEKELACKHALNNLQLICANGNRVSSDTIYYQTQREYLVEDARSHTLDYIAYKRDCDPWDIEDELEPTLDRMEAKGWFAEMAQAFDDSRRCDVADDDIWERVIYNFFTDHDIEEA